MRFQDPADRLVEIRPAIFEYVEDVDSIVAGTFVILFSACQSAQYSRFLPWSWH